jgi:hypothetical protein
MVGSPGHQLADPDHQQWSPHNAQICAAGAERGIDAATAPNGGYACACSTQINYVSLLLDRLLRPVRAAARTRSRCLAQVRHPQDSGIL